MILITNNMEPRPGEGGTAIHLKDDIYAERKWRQKKMRTIEPKVIYIAGPMAGLPELNRPAFMEAEKALTEVGFVVLNPAWLPVGLPPEKYMPICLAMLDAAGAVYMLKGWERSRGALIERSYALYQRKAVFEPEKEGEKE